MFNSKNKLSIASLSSFLKIQYACLKVLANFNDWVKLGSLMEREKISVTVLQNEILNLMPRSTTLQIIYFATELNNYCFR